MPITDVTKIRILNKLGLSNIIRFYYFRYHPLNKKSYLFYQQFIKPGDLCFDIGANIGIKTDLFLRLGAKVVAVEPQKDCFNFILRNLGNNTALTVVNKAVDAVMEEKAFYVCEANALSTLSPEWIASVQQSGRYKDYAWGKFYKVQTTTLDELIKEFGCPVFCKIDVEGCEEYVFKGLSRPIPLLSFEVSPETMSSVIKCIDYIKRLGEVKFNFCWESQGMYFPKWLRDFELLDYFKENSNQIYGDCYVRIV